MPGSRRKSKAGSFFWRRRSTTRHRHGTLTSIASSIQNFFRRRKCVTYGWLSREIPSLLTSVESPTRIPPRERLQNMQPNPSAAPFGDTPNSSPKQSTPSKVGEPSNRSVPGQNCLCPACQNLMMNGKTSAPSPGSSNVHKGAKHQQSPC